MNDKYNFDKKRISKSNPGLLKKLDSFTKELAYGKHFNWLIISLALGGYIFGVFISQFLGRCHVEDCDRVHCGRSNYCVMHCKDESHKHSYDKDGAFWTYIESGKYILYSKDGEILEKHNSNYFRPPHRSSGSYKYKSSSSSTGTSSKKTTSSTSSTNNNSSSGSKSGTTTQKSSKYTSSSSSKSQKMPDCDDYDSYEEFMDDWDGYMPDGSDAEDYWEDW